MTEKNYSVVELGDKMDVAISKIEVVADAILDSGFLKSEAGIVRILDEEVTELKEVGEALYSLAKAQTPSR